MTYPNVIYPSSDHADRLIFLAGPCRGAPDWHAEAAEIIAANMTEFGFDENTLTLADPSNYCDDFDLQVAWETKMLERAAREGCILFWLAKEETHHPERVYAQTTSFELGEWWGRINTYRPSYWDELGIKVVVGIEAGFSGEKYIRTRLGPQIPVFDNLKDTVHAALLVCELRNRAKTENLF